MKVSEALDHMTKSFLHRIIDSFTRDLPKPEEERARKIILRNVEELTDRGRIATVLGFEGPYSDRILNRYILEALINRPDHTATEEEIIEEVSALERTGRGATGRTVLRVPRGARPARPGEPADQRGDQEGPRNRRRVRGRHPLSLPPQARPRIALAGGLGPL